MPGRSHTKATTALIRPLTSSTVSRVTNGKEQQILHTSLLLTNSSKLSQLPLALTSQQLRSLTLMRTLCALTVARRDTPLLTITSVKRIPGTLAKLNEPLGTPLPL
jgi:hypothetical protein